MIGRGQGDGASSTIPDDREPTRLERLFHVASISLVTVIVLSAAVGLFGIRTGGATATANGYRLTVTAPSIARPGLAAPFAVEVSTTDGATLPETVTVRIDASYLAIFDENGLDPDPATGFNDGRWIWWSFRVPAEAAQLTVDFDARIEPGVQWRTAGSAAVVIDGHELVSTEFTTWVMP